MSQAANVTSTKPADVAAPMAPRTVAPASRDVARALSLPFLAGPAAGGLLLAVPGQLDDRPLAFAALLLCVLAIGLALRFGALDHQRPGVFALLVAAGVVAVSVGLVLAGPGQSLAAVFYLWLLPYAYIYFSRTQAWLLSLLASACFATTLLLVPPAGADAVGVVVLWVWLTATVGITGLVIHSLATQARSGDRRLMTAFGQSSTPSLIADRDGRIVHANGALGTMLGLIAAELPGRSADSLFATADSHLVRETIAEGPLAHTGRQTWRLGTADGSVLVCRAAFSTLSLEPARILIQLENVTAQVGAERDLAALARDNQLILDCAGDGIYRIDRDGTIVFANPAAGQLLGRPVSELVGADALELMQHTHADGTPYRRELSPIWNATRTGRVTRVVDEVFWRKDGTSFPVDYTSAPFRDEGQIGGAVCVFADISGRDAFEKESSYRDEARRFLGAALREDRMLVYGQPIIDLRTEGTVMHELLVRMKGDDDHQVIAPAAFLPDAERYGMIEQIDVWMVEQALALVRGGRRVTVNLSMRSLAGTALLAAVENGIARSDIDPSAVVFEITETAAVDQLDVARGFATRLTELGCFLALDDFGTGFGSFNYLKNFPARYLKIDREFVRHLLTSESDRRIVKTIVRVAADFGHQTIAEGVEDEPTLKLLKRLGVDYAQGYLIGRPGPLSP